ncbi:MAG: transporter substrate-binding domain-containing protein [Methylobacteriaceae bacterium]|nr:transporter substrate-binding domain-containing protein [Methylobacteriaceae bacterium]
MRNPLRPAFLALAWLALAVAPARADTIRIATEGAYPPFNYVENGEPAGFEVDLARALCAAMHATCSFVLQDWDSMIAGLKENRYDAIVSSMEITPERQKRIAFTRRYYRVPAALIAQAVDPLPAGPPGLPDLAGKSVGTTGAEEFTTFLEERAKGATVRVFDKVEDAALDLLTDRIDFVLGDKLALSNWLQSREGACCRFAGDVAVERPGVGVGLRKADTALLARFDAAIADVIADGTYDRIRAKYIPFDIK